MDDVVLINFKNIHIGSHDTIRFSRNDDVRAIKQRWGDKVKCDAKAYHFRMSDNSLLPDGGIISDILRKNEFCLGLWVNTIEREGKSNHVDILVSENCDTISFEEFFVSVQRRENGVSVAALRDVIERKLDSGVQGVQLSQRKWKNESGVEIEETVDGFIDDCGRQLDASNRDKQFERILGDDDKILTIRSGHTPVIKYRLVPSLPEPAAQGTDMVDQTCPSSAVAIKSPLPCPTPSTAPRSSTATSEFQISFLDKRKKDSFPLKIPRTESGGVLVNDLRSEVEKRLGFSVNLRQKRARVNDVDVVLTQIGYVNAAGDVWKLDQVQEKENVLLKDNDPPLLAHGKSLAVIRASPLYT